MNENHMPEIAKMLGLEMDEFFEIKGKGPGKCKLTEKGVSYILDRGHSLVYDNTFIRILTGAAEIIRKPWRPGMGGIYWTVLRKHIDDEGYITDSRVYFGTEIDIGLIAMGNCFRTRDDAKAAAPEVLKFYEDVRKMVEEK